MPLKYMKKLPDHLRIFSMMIMKYELKKRIEGLEITEHQNSLKKVGLFELDKGNLFGCTHHPDSIKVSKSNDSITLFCYDKSYETSTVWTNPSISRIKR